MNYTEQQIEEWKSKAEKWDALDLKISTYYDEDELEGLFDDDDEERLEEGEGNLLDIGEAAARAFGYM